MCVGAIYLAVTYRLHITNDDERKENAILFNIYTFIARIISNHIKSYQ